MSRATAIHVALLDAATNCERDSAVAVITTNAGATVEGYLRRPSTGAETVMVETQGGGWATVAVEEIAIVESKRRARF